ncbi:MAG: ABC transporter ATP-binding protein [Chloroflexi bacterium]|nr:MAG: ABC transporter ATP-binding protein [Chloroflexota bacterium]
MNVALNACGLGKRYGNSWALRDCSLRVPAGRITGLVGPNGAGKTTLLRMAVGLLGATSGEISVFGWSPTEHPALVLARVGFVPQERPLYSGFTVGEILQLGRHLNPRWDQAGAAARLKRLDIGLNRKVAHLSGGQHAQVSLALALGKRPDLLLLDEPLSNLDPLARREFMKALVEVVAAEGLSVILSSHVVAELERVCDHLVILNGGRVQVVGDIDELVATHKLQIAPRQDSDVIDSDATVIQATHTDGQSAMLVKVGSRAVRPDWEVHDVSLEEMVLAYLGNPAAADLPAPVMQKAG